MPHEYLLFDDEGHGFAKPAEPASGSTPRPSAFLAEHLGGRSAEPASSRSAAAGASS